MGGGDRWGGAKATRKAEARFGINKSLTEFTMELVPLPKFDPSKTECKEGEEFVALRGVLDIDKRSICSEDISLNDLVGVAVHGSGASNFANVERFLASLNGCEVEVKIKVLKFPEAVVGQEQG